MNCCVFPSAIVIYTYAVATLGQFWLHLILLLHLCCFTSGAVNVSLSPTKDPVTYLFRAASANNTIMLSCSWDADAYYAAWLRDGAPFYGEDRVRGLQLEEYGSFSGTASVTTNFAAQSSTLQVTDAFITDSANYTCAVTCRARQVVRGEVLEVSEEFSATREVLVLGEWTLLLLI